MTDISHCYFLDFKSSPVKLKETFAFISYSVVTVVWLILDYHFVPNWHFCHETILFYLQSYFLIRFNSLTSDSLLLLKVITLFHEKKILKYPKFTISLKLR